MTEAELKMLDRVRPEDAAAFLRGAVFRLFAVGRKVANAPFVTLLKCPHYQIDMFML